MTEVTEKLPNRLKRILERLRGGEVLCKTFIFDQRGASVEVFALHPSGRILPELSSKELISSGLVVPQNDGLFDASSSQTWRAA